MRQSAIRWLTRSKPVLLLILVSATSSGISALRPSTLSAEAGNVLVLDDFESATLNGRWQGPARLSGAHPSHGRSCLEVRFDSKSTTLSASLPDSNWSGFDRLLFDVYNPERVPKIFSLRVDGAASGPNTGPPDYFDAQRKLFVGAGWTHVEVILKNLEVALEPRPFPLDRVRRLTISAASSQPATVYVDNFRLVKGREEPLTASRRAPQDIITRLDGRWVSIWQVGPPDKIPESVKVRNLRAEAEKEYRALKVAVQTSKNMGVDTTYSQVELFTAELGLDFRPLLAWFNNDYEKERMFAYVLQACRHERERLESLLRGEVRPPDRDDTQVPPPLIPEYPRLRGLEPSNGFFTNKEGRPLFIISVHGPSKELQQFFATPAQHIESYSVGGGSRWTIDTSPVYEAYKEFPDTHRVGWDGWCGHLIRNAYSMGGKKESVVICLESPHTREAVEQYIVRESKRWRDNPDLLYNIMAYELQYICFCQRSQQMFRAWLESKHHTLERLNEAWGTHHASFEEITAPPTNGGRPLPGTNRAQWFDWAVFNQERFTDYLVWVKSIVRRFDPRTPIAAGGSSSMLVGSNGTSGIDEEQIINRVDDVILHEGSGSTLGLDLQIALSDTAKPVCDPEMNLGQARYLLPHMLHGKSVIQIWHWPDQRPAEHPHFIDHSPAHGWSWPLPEVAGLLRTVLDARRLSPEIAAFFALPAQAAILYSKTSMLQVPPEMLTWETTPYLRELGNSYEESRCLDTRVTFVSENGILAGKLKGFKVLIVPAVSHEMPEVVEAILRFVEQGGTLVLLPSSFLSDQYNRPANFLSQMGVEVRRIEEPAADRTSEVEQAYDQSFHERVVYRPQEITNLAMRPIDIFARDMPGLQAQGTQQEILLSGASQTLAAFPGGQPALVKLARGRGVIYYSAASFPRSSLSALLDRIFDASGIDRPVRVRGELGQPLRNLEARFVSSSAGKLLYLANLNDQPVKARIEVQGTPARKLFELRKQEKVAGESVGVPAGETLIFRLD